jgi:hypothetical protein
VSDVPTVHARVQTPRAERYLAQLADHLTQVGQHGQHGVRHRHEQQEQEHGRQGQGSAAGDVGAGAHDGPPAVRHVERTDRHARIDFDWGGLVLTATASELILLVEADDPHALARGQELIEHRVHTIGRREQLTVAWQAAEADDA